jgi:streptogramin lyase
VIDLDTQLRQTGESWRASQPEPHVDFTRVAIPRRSRRIVRVAVVALAAAAVVALGLVTTRATHHTRLRVAQEEPTTSARPAPPKAIIEPNHEITQVQTFSAVDGKLWVTGDAPNEGPAHVEQIDPASGAVIVDVTLPDNGPYALVVCDGAVWVRAQQGEASTALFKIDIATQNVVATLVGQKDGGLVVTPSAVWMNDNGGLERVDPETVKVITTIPLVAAGPYTSLGVVTGPLGIWTVNSYTGQLQHIDTTHNTAGPALQITTGNESIEWLAEIDHSLWVEEYPNRLVELDVNGRKLRTLTLGTGERTFDPKTDGRYIWLGTEHSHVFRVDATTGTVATIDLPAGFSGSTNLSIDAATGDVWVSTLNPAPRLVLISRGVSR